MSERAVEVERVSKRYRLGATVGGRLSEALVGVFGRRQPDASEREFWALRDVSMHVDEGEVVGIVGRNGAGKSTMLKILSQITPPTEGRVTLRGRVGSLLEVGTGFHPELTGRENVFLNGTILGMTRAEVSARFDEIVAFSGVERFLETPVKRYSSGMVVRLAFAVAAHLEPEILIVDEVLAVGDAEFQRRCLGKMHEISHGGRTVLFVSHNLAAVKQLCDRAYLLDAGRVCLDGGADEVVAAYLRDAGATQRDGHAEVAETAERVGTGDARLRSVSLLAGRQPIDRLSLDARPSLTLVFDVERPVSNAAIEVGIATAEGARVLTVQTIDWEGGPLALGPGRHEVVVDIDTTLLPGEFTVDVGLHLLEGLSVDYVTGALAFSVVNASESSTDFWPWTQVRGQVRPRSTWHFAGAVDWPSAISATAPSTLDGGQGSAAT